MKQLFRSRKDSRIAGICGGLAEYFDVDPNIVRLVVVVMGLATGIFPFVIGYVVAWWIVPQSPAE